jgi:hypothetical protein
MTPQDDDLDDLFATAAASQARPSDALFARILADADAWQPRPAAPAPRPGWLATLADWFGGGFSLAGMSAAALTGLYLGIAQPVPLTGLTEFVTGSVTLDSLDLMPSNGALWAQE